MESVKNTQALLGTRNLAECYARKASDSRSMLPDSPAKQAFGDLAAAFLVLKTCVIIVLWYHGVGLAFLRYIEKHKSFI